MRSLQSHIISKPNEQFSTGVLEGISTTLARSHPQELLNGQYSSSKKGTA